ncbi:class I SAM-dependent methyltransferase [Salinibacterium soli]|uniref:Class I SAM-dependent methyltransferase n=1 Tax=Antiquaquibacter soli TaxID=3064523 RepID=A0ABT9BPR1_9MICO|nr:class I SAM-dependent methyltransferase [Protaetiibacter sp. WY-16]MDO7881292.1 class I SAM-dependent methyltransferase [Protaetiibacter sp. WY-16]
MGESVVDITAADIVGWDVRTWSKAVDYWRAELPASAAPLRCLEIGAGPGGPSLWLALQGHEVTCSNFQNTREQASPLHERFGIRSIAYEDIDANDIPYEGEFDIVIFKSVLGGAASTVEAQAGVIRQIHAALKPGGTLLYAENLRGTWLHRAARAVAYRVRRASWRFVSPKELRGMLAVFDRHEFRSTGFLSLFGVTEAQRGALAAADDAVFNRVPQDWRYVGFGKAVKRR